MIEPRKGLYYSSELNLIINVRSIDVVFIFEGEDGSVQWSEVCCLKKYFEYIGEY